jgi:hypothetical protein
MMTNKDQWQNRSDGAPRSDREPLLDAWCWLDDIVALRSGIVDKKQDVQ